MAYGANPNYLYDNPSYSEGYPAALYQAIKTGNLEIIKLLMENGAHAGLFLIQAIKSTNSLEKIKMLLMCGADVNSTDHDTTKRTALHNAVIHFRDIKVVSLLMHFGVDVNAKDAWMQTPLHYAFKCRSEEFELLKILMENGANPYLKYDESGSTIEKTLDYKSTKYFKAILYNQCHIF